MRRVKSAPASYPHWQKVSISNMNKNVMGKILQGNMKTALALKKIGGRSNITENVARKFVANMASRKMQRRRNATNLVFNYRTGTPMTNAVAYGRMMTRMRAHTSGIPMMNAGIIRYFESQLPKRNLTNRNIAIIFLQATPAALRAFYTSNNPERTTLGRKLYV